ncbi:MAG: hypothetical protein AAB393_13825, partial [Bacteroidota bacterium]
SPACAVRGTLLVMACRNAGMCQHLLIGRGLKINTGEVRIELDETACVVLLENIGDAIQREICMAQSVKFRKAEQ